MSLRFVLCDAIDFNKVSKPYVCKLCMSFQTSGYSTYVIREAVGNSFSAIERLFLHFKLCKPIQISSLTLQIVT